MWPGLLEGESMFTSKLSAHGEGWCGHPCDTHFFTEEQLSESCGSSATCRFDACATRNLTIAAITRDIENEFENKTHILGKYCRSSLRQDTHSR